MAQSAHPAIPYGVAGVRERTAATWYIWCGVLGVSPLCSGSYWDISWHMSIGRDTFWTPAHLAIQLGGILVATISAYLIFWTTWSHDVAAKAASIKVWGFCGPLGAFLACWGGVMMVTPRLSITGGTIRLDWTWRFQPAAHGPWPGIMAVAIGALLLLVSWMNRTEGDAHVKFAALSLSRWCDFVAALGAAFRICRREQMHSPDFYVRFPWSSVHLGFVGARERISLGCDSDRGDLHGVWCWANCGSSAISRDAETRAGVHKHHAHGTTGISDAHLFCRQLRSIGC